MANRKVKDINLINPVDYYNKYHHNDAIDILLEVNNVRKIDISSFTYYENKADLEVKKIIINEHNEFVIKQSCGNTNLIVGNVYSSFMIMQHFKFKKNWRQASSYVVNKLMGYSNQYIRVGTRYNKIVDKIDRYGVKRTEFKIWDKMTIVDDFGRGYLGTIEHYDDFTIEPDNKNYRAIIGNNYNLYSEFSHKSEEIVGNIGDLCKWTLILLKHVFGEHFELGLIYLKVLYDHPKQIMPILVLVSKERGTGKTTFVNWLTILFGGNAVIVNPQDMSSSFNSSYADKNIIIIEESRFDNVQTTEKLKNLATQKKILIDTKFVAPYSVPFYGKLIITSNDRNKFSKVDDEEIRYWVRELPVIEKGKGNHSIESDLTDEIPYFLGYLDTLPDVDLTRSRMVFLPEELQTDALARVKKESRPQLHKNIEMYLDNHCEQNYKVEYIYFTSITIKETFFKHDSKSSVSYIREILDESMGLEKLKSLRKIVMEQNSSSRHDSKNGRYYKYKNKYFNGNKQESSILSK